MAIPKGAKQTVQYLEIPAWWYDQVKALGKRRGHKTAKAFFIDTFHKMLLEDADKKQPTYKDLLNTSLKEMNDAKE